jgi:hypothetical protein
LSKVFRWIKLKHSMKMNQMETLGTTQRDFRGRDLNPWLLCHEQGSMLWSKFSTEEKWRFFSKSNVTIIFCINYVAVGIWS